MGNNASTPPEQPAANNNNTPVAWLSFEQCRNKFGELSTLCQDVIKRLPGHIYQYVVENPCTSLLLFCGAALVGLYIAFGSGLYISLATMAYDGIATALVFLSQTFDLVTYYIASNILAPICTFLADHWLAVLAAACVLVVGTSICVNPEYFKNFRRARPIPIQVDQVPRAVPGDNPAAQVICNPQPIQVDQVPRAVPGDNPAAQVICNPQPIQVYQAPLEAVIENDEALERYKCPINLSLCRKPVRLDGERGVEYYFEREAIVDWYRYCRAVNVVFHHPCSKQPLQGINSEDDLIVDVNARAFIENRARTLREEYTAAQVSATL